MSLDNGEKPISVETQVPNQVPVSTFCTPDSNQLTASDIPKTTITTETLKTSTYDVKVNVTGEQADPEVRERQVDMVQEYMFPEKQEMRVEVIEPRQVSVGRPSTYSDEIANTICDEIAKGRSLKSICDNDEGMPVMSTVFLWLSKNNEFSENYARAKDSSAEVDHEKLEEIGDIAIEDSKTVDPKAAGAVVSAYKLKADNIKWLMERKKPKKYGSKVDLTSGGEPIKGNTIVFSDFTIQQKEKDATDSQPSV